MSKLAQEYAALLASLEQPPPPKKPSSWRTIFKWAGIGCAGWVGLMIILATVAGLMGKPLQPLPTTRPTPIKDTLPAQPVSDSLPLGTSAPLPVVVEPPPPPVPPKTVEQPPTPVKKVVTVYTTRTGSKYHRAGCSSLRKSSNPMDLTEAQRYYEPCGRCKPPR